MSRLVRRDPFFNEFPSMTRLMNQFFAEPFAVAIPDVDEGTLAVDVSEDERSVIVRASLPGFEKQDVQIEVHDNVLTINAQHTEEKEESGEKFYRKERRVGSLSRRIALPSPVRDTDAKADLASGVLTLRLPKAQVNTPKKIQIN